MRDRTTIYAHAVLSGDIVAGCPVRAACKRHLSDFERTDGLYYFDLEEAERAIDFFPDVLRLNGGKFEGKPFHLLLWQQFIVGSIFGWKTTLDGFRRFRSVFIETAKGSGKSPLAAGFGIKGLVADNEPRSEVYSAATKKDQAMILFRDAVAMVDQSELLSERITKSGTGERVWNLAYLKNGSFFRPISSDDGQSGPRPHIGLIDEIHEHKNNNVVEMIRAGTKSRTQALIFMITNSGAGRNGPCWEYHEYAIKVAEGTLEDDSFFAYVCSLDMLKCETCDGQGVIDDKPCKTCQGAKKVPENPLEDENCWHKANPSLADGIPGVKYLREQVTGARGMPSKESIVRRLNFCQWTDAANPWISSDVWLSAGRSYTLEQFRGRKAYAGLDLSSTTDLTSFVLLIEPIKPGEPWHVIPFSWLPDFDLSGKEKRDRVPYTQWHQNGHLEVTQGRAVSKLSVLKRIISISEIVNIQAIAYDRWRIADLRQMADDEGLELPTMVSFGQGFKDMSPALESFETALLNGELVHSNNPVLTWCAANAVAVSDDAENKKLSKREALGRIDTLVAAVMAAGVALGEKIETEEEIEAGFVAI